jgi:uncharacterized protein (TIGR04255 family)
MVGAPFGSAVAEVPLPRAPLVFVVAQARFERLASVSSEDFIGPFQEAIRGTYPIMNREQQAGVLVGPDGEVVTAEGGVVWRFSERPERWEVALAPNFVALSTPRYTRRQEFLDRFAIVLGAARDHLNVRFCDRLGVRYVDRVSDPDLLSRISELLKPEVLGAVAVGLGEPDVKQQHQFVDSLFHLADDTELHARWGLLPPAVTFDPAIEATQTPSWVLDLDAYTTGQREFDPRALASVADSLAQRVYRYFRWAVTDQFLTEHGGQL